MKRTGTVVLVLLLASAFAGAQDLERLTRELTGAVAQCRQLAARQAPYDVAFRRDPMRPIVDEQGRLLSSTGLSGGLSVQGILWSSTKPLVIVDDELIGLGQRIGPYTVLTIEPSIITVQRDGTSAPESIPLDRGP